MPPNKTFDQKIGERQRQADKAEASLMTNMAKSLNEQALHLDVPDNLPRKSNSSLMDLMLENLLGKQCNIIFKDRGTLDGVTLKAFDENYLLVYGYFDLGLRDPVYREMLCEKSSIKLISEYIDRDQIAENLRRHQIQYDPTI